MTYFLCCRLTRRKQFHSKLLQAKKQLKRELDIEKFIKRQRMLTTAILSLLSGKQIYYASKMAQMVTYDEDEKGGPQGDSDNSYSDGDTDLLGNIHTSKSMFVDRIAKDLISSRDRVDMRLL